MADLDEISGVQGLLLSTRQACTPKCPGVHAEAQACTGSSGWFRRRKTHQSQAWSVHIKILRKTHREAREQKKNCAMNVSLNSSHLLPK